MEKSRQKKLKEHTIWFRPGFEFRPLLSITEHIFTQIGSHVFKQINQVVHFEIEDKRAAVQQAEERNRQIDSESGLDCSGQGECQPGVTPSDGDDMQSFLVNANKKPRCKRNQAQRARNKKQVKIS